MNTAHVDGDWDVAIKTPIGTLAVRYVFTQGPAGLEGTATFKDETVPLQDISRADSETGTRLTWRQSVSKPMRLNLNFDVVFDGDAMTGHSRAGKLPKSAVTGRRRVASPAQPGAAGPTHPAPRVASPAQPGAAGPTHPAPRPR